MAELVPRFGAREIANAPIRTFPLERAADAQRALETGDTVGKLVLVP